MKDFQDKTRLVLIVSIILNILFITTASHEVVKRGGMAYISQKINLILGNYESVESNIQGAHFKNKTSLFDAYPKSKGDIIFLGDSITEGCDWAEIFQNANIRNRGIGSDTTTGVLHRLEEIYSSKPKKLFIMIGINDLGKKIPIEIIKQNYLEILKTVKNKSPETQIIVQSVLPVNEKMHGHHTSNRQVVILNSELKKICDQENLVYIDLYKIFDAGIDGMDRKYTNDGIHLNGSGYYLWKESLGVFLN